MAVFDQKADEESEVTESWHREIIASDWLGSTDAIEYGRFQRLETAFLGAYEVSGRHR